MYNDKTLDHFKNPRNSGALEDANAIGLVGGATCGDILKLYLKIEDDIIVKATFETFGCAAAIASSSIATEIIIGKTTSEALAITNSDIVTSLEGLPPRKIHCSVLASEAIEKAINDYRGNKSQ